MLALISGNVTYLLELFSSDSRYSSPKARNTLCCIISCNVVYLLAIALLIFEMREMKPVGAIGMQLQEPRSNDVIIQVNSFTTNVSFSFQYQPRLIRDDKVIVDELSIKHIATIGEESEPAGHIRDASATAMYGMDQSSRIVVVERCQPFAVSLFGDRPAAAIVAGSTYVTTAIMSAITMCQGLEPQAGASGSRQILVLLVRKEIGRVCTRKGERRCLFWMLGSAGDVIERQLPAVLDQLQDCASLL